MIMIFLVRKQQDGSVKIVFSQLKKKINQDSQAWFFTVITETSSLKQDEDQESRFKTRSMKTAGTSASEIQHLMFPFSKRPDDTLWESCVLN